MQTEELLREAAARGDAPADRLIDHLVQGVALEDLLEHLVGAVRLATRVHLDPQLTALPADQRHRFDEFLAQTATRPAWADPELAERGARFFREHVWGGTFALAAASLPNCYCWSREAAVLMRTQRLAAGAPRRILETAQFVLDVMSPQGLAFRGRPYTRGVQAAQKVRLMHAVVRFMLERDDVKRAMALERRAADPMHGLLDPVEEGVGDFLGEVPISQEQLVATLLTFSIVILRGFATLGIHVSTEESRAYLHAWNVVGSLIGIEERYLERTAEVESADELWDAVMRRHRAQTADAAALTGALADYLAEDLDLVLGAHRWLPVRRIPKLSMKLLLEPETLRAVGVTLDRADRWLYPPFRAFSVGVGRLQNVPRIGRLSELLFGYLSRKVWGWSHLPFAGSGAAGGLAVRTPGLRNWADSVETMPARVEFPSTTAEVAAILADTRQYPSPVRAMGCYHSTTPCASADGGTIVRFEKFRRILEIGPDFVETEAGALYIDVAHELHRRGLEFYVNLQIGNITMAAAACSTTKDGAFPGEYAQASSYCTAMTLVTASGALRKIDESEPELMQAARCSHGLFGVVCAVRFRVRPIEPVSIEHRTLSVEDFLRELPALKDCGGSIEYYLYPFIDRVTVQIRRKAQTAGEVNRWVWRLRNFSVSRVVPLAARALGAIPGRALRDAVSALFYRVASRGLQWTCRAQRTYASGQTTRYRQPPGRFGFSFALWGFPEAEFPQILRDYIALTKRHYAQTGYRSHMLTVGYVVSQDANALLSYSEAGRAITIDPTGFAGEDWDRFLDAYNDFCCERGGIPLLNQTPGLTASHVRRAFGERLAKFELIRRTFDPEDRLLNPYFEELLQGEPG